jgi:16S rRNA (guanine527-N7)-methyltransferase
MLFHVKHSRFNQDQSFMCLHLSSEERSILIDGFECYGIQSDDSVISRLGDYTALVRDWSTRMNLVSLRDCERFVEYHLLDSLKTAVCVDYTSMHRILDFGSGAGLPGIPLAIVYGHIDVTLLDSRLKRSVFLEHAVSSLSLENASVVRNRIEELPHSFDRSFDCVITRATTGLSEFLRLAHRFLSPGGILVSIKGDTISSELEALDVSLKMLSCDKKSRAHHRFNSVITVPPPYVNVRQGHIVTITKT